MLWGKYTKERIDVMGEVGTSRERIVLEKELMLWGK